MHDITVLHDVILTFDAHLAGFANGCFRAIADVIVVLDDLSTDETLLEVGVNDAGTLWSLPATLVGPSLYFHLSGRDKGLEIQQFVGLFDEAVDATLLQTQLFEEELLVLVGLQFGDVFLGFGCDDHHFGTFFAGNLLYPTAISIAILGRSLVDVAHVEHGFRGQKEQLAGSILLVLGVELHDAGVLALLQHFLIGLQHTEFHLGVLVTGGSCLLGLGDTGIDSLKVFQLKFRIDDFLVADGVDSSIDMRDVIVVETAQNVDDSIGFADVSEELIAQTFALGGSFHEAGDVDDFARSRHYATGMHQFGQLGQALIGHGNHANVGFNRTKREISCLCFCTRKAVEKGRLAHVRQSHNTTF